MSPRPAAGALATGLAGVTVALTALALGAAPLLLAGIGLLALAISAPLIVLSAGRGIRVERRLVSSRIQEGDRLEAVLTVRRGRAALARLELGDPLAPEPVAVPAGRVSELSVRSAAPGRGRHLIPAPEVMVSDPLGLVRAVRRGVGASELLVLPRLAPVRWAAGGQRQAGSGTRPGPAPGSQPLGAGEVDGLRPYRHGTPASRIHWPALARGAGLLEREVRPAAEGWPLVALDLRGAASTEDCDAAVRAAASLAVEFARRGGVRLALPGERRARAIGPDLAAWPHAHVRLALVGGGRTGDPPPPPAAGGGQLFLVRAGAVAPRVDGPDRGTILVLPAGIRPSRRGPVLTVSGCVGYDLSRLSRAAA